MNACQDQHVPADVTAFEMSSFPLKAKKKKKKKVWFAKHQQLWESNFKSN